MQESCPEKENSPAGQMMEQEVAPAVEEVPPLQAAYEYPYAGSVIVPK